MGKPTVVSSHKGVTVAASHLAVHEFPSALEGDVHVAVDGLELAYVLLLANVF